MGWFGSRKSIVSELKPLKKEIDFMRAHIATWRDDLKGSTDPKITRVVGEMTKILSRWEDYGLGKHVKSYGGILS